MEKTAEYQRGVIAITNLAREINNAIGSYQEHFINENFGFTIRLSNGRIEMSVEMAQDYEKLPSSVTMDQVEKVAKTFKVK